MPSLSSASLIGNQEVGLSQSLVLSFAENMNVSRVGCANCLPCVSLAAGCRSERRLDGLNLL